MVTGSRPLVPKAKTVREALLQWYRLGGHDQHLYPLREWPQEWLQPDHTQEPGKQRKILALWGQRELLAKGYELTAKCGEFTEAGFQVFVSKYPQKAVSNVLTAIRDDMKAAGAIRGRKRAYSVESDDTTTL